jgi:hypothetical protein
MSEIERIALMKWRKNHRCSSALFFVGATLNMSTHQLEELELLLQKYSDKLKRNDRLRWIISKT